MISDLPIILEEHKKWLNNEQVGKRADLQGADLQGANLRRADLQGADLQGADLRRADLQVANLQVANLWKADLRRANLKGANLWKADLRGADLRGAELDYSCWPLWCGSFGVKIDKRFAVQILYHFCRLNCEDDDIKKAQTTLYNLANQFHRVIECGKLVETEDK